MEALLLSCTWTLEERTLYHTTRYHATKKWKLNELIPANDIPPHFSDISSDSESDSDLCGPDLKALRKRNKKRNHKRKFKTFVI